LELNAIEQISEGIVENGANGGMLITTGNSTEELEEYAQIMSEKIKMPIDIIAGVEVANFVIRYAPNLLFGEIDS